MARNIGPKNRLARRVGADLSFKTNSLKANKRINVRPGMHGKKAKRKGSEYGEQLNEKQKVKFLYGVLEKQLRKLYEKAAKTPAATGKVLLSLLERRLDNVVYRLGFAPTRAAARQMVAHGHVKVDGQKVSVPSYTVSVDEVITMSETAMKIPAVAVLLKEKDKAVPAWLKREAAAGKIARVPERDDVDAGINEQMIVEFYSR